ncbi:MAG: hypothetical protein K0R28_5067, partial [Paenibacillus sp.]|nr:hypothetical protein [Paenibacillus sp.]
MTHICALNQPITRSETSILFAGVQ